MSVACHRGSKKKEIPNDSIIIHKKAIPNDSMTIRAEHFSSLANIGNKKCGHVRMRLRGGKREKTGTIRSAAQVSNLNMYWHVATF